MQPTTIQAVIQITFIAYFAAALLIPAFRNRAD